MDGPDNYTSPEPATSFTAFREVGPRETHFSPEEGNSYFAETWVVIDGRYEQIGSELFDTPEEAQRDLEAVLRHRKRMCGVR